MNPGFGEIIGFSLGSRLIVSPERTRGAGSAARVSISRWNWSLGSGGPSSAALNCVAKLRSFASKRRSLRRRAWSLERHQRRTPVEVPDQPGVKLSKSSCLYSRKLPSHARLAARSLHPDAKTGRVGDTGPAPTWFVVSHRTWCEQCIQGYGWPAGPIA